MQCMRFVARTSAQTTRAFLALTDDNTRSRAAPLLAWRMSKIVLVLMMLCMSCGTFVQKSVRSDSVYCSDSRLYFAGDLLVAASYAFVASGAARSVVGAGPQQLNEPLAYLPIPLFVGSAAIGAYKRHNCVAWKAEAPPEEWARAAAVQQQREAECVARAAEQQAIAERMAAAQQQPPPPVAPEPAVTSASHTPTALDEVGTSCTGRWPDAGTCRYGAVCYAGACTTWCPSGGGCAAGYQCTNVRDAGKVCLRVLPTTGLDPFAR